MDRRDQIRLEVLSELDSVLDEAQWEHTQQRRAPGNPPPAAAAEDADASARLAQIAAGKGAAEPAPERREPLAPGSRRIRNGEPLPRVPHAWET